MPRPGLVVELSYRGRVSSSTALSLLKFVQILELSNLQKQSFVGVDYSSQKNWFIVFLSEITKKLNTCLNYLVFNNLLV